MAMRFPVATLCDFAQARDGVIFISSGGITRLYRPSYPAPMGAMLALVVEASRPEIAERLQVRVAVEDADGKVISQVVAGLQMNRRPNDLEKGEQIQMPLPIDLRSVPLPAAGRYLVRVSCPGIEHTETALSFAARQLESKQRPPQEPGPQDQ